MSSDVSMLRTVELILGFPPLTQFDVAATPLYNMLFYYATYYQFVCHL